MADEWCVLQDREGAAEAIRRMGRDDLLFLNGLIAERLRLIEQARSAVLLSRFRAGDRVSFRTAEGELKTGTITKLNTKTVAICTGDGRHWRVWPGYLLPPADAPGQGGTGLSSSVPAAPASSPQAAWGPADRT